MEDVFDAQQIVDGVWVSDYNSSQRSGDVVSRGISYFLYLMHEITTLVRDRELVSMLMMPPIASWPRLTHRSNAA